MALTQYGSVPSTTLAGTLASPTPPTTYAITGFSYTNPNVTITLSTTHNYQVGNVVNITGMVQSGTSIIYATNQITAVGANTFTFNFGATAPSTYTSGGTVQLVSSGNVNGTKVFSNGVSVVSTTQGSYFYTTDNVTWNIGQIPNGSVTITAMEYDGVNYIFGTGTSGIWTSATLAPGSWTQRSTFGGFYVNAIKWCAGSVSRVVAVGSGDTAYNGTTARIEVATQGGTSWTNQTLSGTNSYAALDLAFDGTSTIITFSSGMGPIVSTSGAGSWTGYAANATHNSQNLAGQPNLYPTFSFYTGIYNLATSRWAGFSVGNGYINGHTSAASPTVPWTRTTWQFMPFAFPFQQTTGFYSSNISNPITFDSAKNLIYAHGWGGGDVKIIAYNATPVVSTNGGSEQYPIAAVYTIPIGFAEAFMYNTTTQTYTRHSVGYGLNKWAIGVSHNNVTTSTGSGYYLGVYQ